MYGGGEKTRINLLVTLERHVLDPIDCFALPSGCPIILTIQTFRVVAGGTGSPPSRASSTRRRRGAPSPAGRASRPPPPPTRHAGPLPSPSCSPSPPTTPPPQHPDHHPRSKDPTYSDFSLTTLRCRQLLFEFPGKLLACPRTDDSCVILVGGWCTVVLVLLIVVKFW